MSKKIIIKKNFNTEQISRERERESLIEILSRVLKRVSTLLRHCDKWKLLIKILHLKTINSDLLQLQHQTIHNFHRQKIDFFSNSIFLYSLFSKSNCFFVTKIMLIYLPIIWHHSTRIFNYSRGWDDSTDLHIKKGIATFSQLTSTTFCHIVLKRISCHFIGANWSEIFPIFYPFFCSLFLIILWRWRIELTRTVRIGLCWEKKKISSIDRNKFHDFHLSDGDECFRFNKAFHSTWFLFSTRFSAVII